MLQPLILKIFATNLQISESFHRSKQMPNNETYSSSANIFNYLTLVLILKFFTLKLGRGRVV